MDDAELVKKYREGDEAAFEEIVGRYSSRLYAFAYRLSGDAALAEDAVQNSFLKAWKNLGKFDERRSFRSWIFSIARNAVIDLLRARKDIPFASMDRDDDAGSFADDLVGDEEAADAAFDRALDAGMLEEILSELPVDSRAVVILHDKEGLTFDEIGKVLKEPLNTVKSRYRRALGKLRLKLQGRKGLDAPKGSVKT